MGKSRPVGREEKRRLWEQHVSGWRTSGLTQAGYCRNHGLSLKSFVYWKSRLMSAKAPVSLVEVPVQGPPYSVCTPLRLLIGGCYCIEIGRGFDADTLQRVLRVIEA